MKKGGAIQGEERLTSLLKQNQGRKYPTATPEEAEARKSALQTQGKKGAKCDRINMAFTPENFDYINIVSRINGMSKTKFVNFMIEEYRKQNSEIYDEAKELVKKASK